MRKKDKKITVFYDEVTRKDIYRLNGVDVTDTIEMLKDKWERQILDTRCRLFQLDMTVQQRLQEQVADLEAKLAEKEKEIDNLHNRLNSKQKFYEMSLEKDYKEYLSHLVKLEKQCDKDKISFAVEQLTQAIKNIKKCNYKDFGIMYQSDAIAVINNQINVLRNNKDGIH